MNIINTLFLSNHVLIRPILWAALVVATSLVEAQQPTAAENGKARFLQNCGICHGVDARGDGAFSEILKMSPPDLTVLAKNNHGEFPFSDVYETIDARTLPAAHGTRTMPIWGKRYSESVGNETLVAGRIFEILLFLQSIQE